jgi:predicted dehydrogenase
MADHPPLKFAAIGLDHRHIYHQVGRLLDLGAECVGYHGHDDAVPLEGFVKRFPDLKRVAEARALLEDPEVRLIVTAGIPGERAEVAIQAMQHGKDVMVDKPGVITDSQLAAVKQAQVETGKIWSVNFSERFEVRAMTRATELIEAGALGRVVQTIGLGPHRLNRHLRPPWFFQRARGGGILADIGSHQIDQFLHFTGSSNAKIVASAVANYANRENPEFEDFGEILLRSDHANGYIRVDWYTPDGLPTWGDGRCTILGTEGTIELRKYVDIAGRAGTDHLFLVTGNDTRYVDCSDAPLPYYERLIADIFARTETAMSQVHCFKVCELALAAQATATRLA